MAVKFKGISEYKRKFKGRSTRSAPQLRMSKAGLRSDQLGGSREPQFHSKRRVSFNRPQVYQSFQWEEPEGSLQADFTLRPNMTPGAGPPKEGLGDTEGAQTPLAPRGPRSSGTRQEGSKPPTQNLPPAAEPHSAVSAVEVEPALNIVHHVLKRKAGLKSAGLANQLLSSEYQRQFQWKTPVTSSPLLAAEQVVYRSRPVTSAFKMNPLVQESEYRRSFKGSPPPRAPRPQREPKQREGAQQVSPERATKNIKKKKKKQQLSSKLSLRNSGPQCSSQSQWWETRSQSPPPAHPSNGGCREVRSEYNSHFRSPLHYQLIDGAWIRSSTAAAEALELREKAQAYRRRAWGILFSRDHLNQIPSEQNCLWEASTPTGTNTERSSTSGTIQALDLASIESVRGSSLPRSPSASKQSSGGGSEEAGLCKASTLPVRRKLVWGEENPAAGPEQKDRDEREKLGKESHGGERWVESEEEEEQEEGGYWSNKATASEDPPLSPTSDSQSSGLMGRLATPKMKTIRSIQRTHHDRTTPTTGGAILVSPPKLKEASAGRSVGRSELPLGKPHSPHKSQSRALLERVGSKVERSSLLRSPPAGGLTTADPISLREDARATHPAPDDPAAPRPAGTSHRHSPASAPSNRILGKLRDPEFQHNGNLGLIRHEIAAIPSADLSDDDDRMSQISAWSAASCSVASQVLDRAQKRHQSFWGNSWRPGPH